MNKKLIALLVIGFFIMPVMAEKPEWAGKGKPTMEQKEAHRAAMNAKGGMDGEGPRQKEKKEKRERTAAPQGFEKQRAKKSEQMQNEIGKGSDKGQESRENSKKWWKFFDE